MLFKYNDQQWFNTDSIETIDDNGSDVLVTLKSGRTVRIYHDDRDRFLAALHPSVFLDVPSEDLSFLQQEIHQNVPTILRPKSHQNVPAMCRQCIGKACGNAACPSRGIVTC